jgi:hypothetical protein
LSNGIPFISNFIKICPVDVNYKYMYRQTMMSLMYVLWMHLCKNGEVIPEMPWRLIGL